MNRTGIKYSTSWKLGHIALFTLAALHALDCWHIGSQVSDRCPLSYLFFSPLSLANCSHTIFELNRIRVYSFLFLMTSKRSQNVFDWWEWTNNYIRAKTNRLTCAPSEYSDQPCHPPSIIGIVAVHYEEPASGGQRRLIRLGGFRGCSESSMGVQVILIVLSCFDYQGNSLRQEFQWPTVSYFLNLIYACKWAATWQNQRSECAPSEDSDQPGHPPSLIRIFAVRRSESSLSAWRNLRSLATHWAHT